MRKEMIGERTEGPHSLRERSPGNLILTTVCTVLECPGRGVDSAKGANIPFFPGEDTEKRLSEGARRNSVHIYK